MSNIAIIGGHGKVALLLGGCDAVMWSAGAGGGSTERTYAVDRDAASGCILRLSPTTPDDGRVHRFSFRFQM